MRFFPQYQPLFAALTERDLVLTPNRRLSRFVTRQHQLWQRQQGLTAWSSVRCLSWQAWVQSIWSGMQVRSLPGADRWLVSAAEERQLWRSVIEEHSNDYPLLVPDSLADVAAQAWQRLLLWRQNARDLPEDIEEVALFKIWAEAFDQRLGQLGALDGASMQARVLTALESGELALPPAIHLLGFDDFNPLQQAFLSALEQSNIAVHHHSPQQRGRVQRVQLADGAAEIERAARWASALVAENNQLSIAIVVPQLAQLRPEVERVFTQVFEPQYILPHKPRHAAGFNISAAQPLAQVPLITAALTALKLNQQSLERADVSALLLSPFIGSERELAPRAVIDGQVQARYLALNLSALRALVGEHQNPDGDIACPGLHQQLLDFTQCALPVRGRKQGYAQWAELFDQQLHCLGWPGTRTLDTLEYQQLAQWPELLEQLAQLDRVAEPVSLTQALSELNRLAYTPFHAQTADSPVQILGLLEAAGQQFDYLWVMNLDDRAWPQACEPNPLLPVALQRRWQMPRASAERELHVARQLTERLCHSAQEVVFSSACTQEDQPLRVSPLIASIAEIDANHLPDGLASNYARLLLGQKLERIRDDVAPEIGAQETVRGGTQILQNQAACPFRAFARHRLLAERQEPLEPGITPIVRGLLLHRALETLWGALQDQQALLLLSEDALEAQIDAALQDAWRSISAARGLGDNLRRLEIERAQHLLLAWMAMEKTRPAFRVLAQEQAQTLSLSGLAIHVRLDRVDELLDSGGRLVIDYKTGQADPKSWASERPDEPQIPLYTMVQEAVQAAAFGVLNAHQVGMLGLGEGGDESPGLTSLHDFRGDLPSTWEALLEHWHQTISRLAQSFSEGQAQVDPKQVTTCRFCDLHGLCRVGSTQEETLSAPVSLAGEQP